MIVPLAPTAFLGPSQPDLYSRTQSSVPILSPLFALLVLELGLYLPMHMAEELDIIHHCLHPILCQHRDDPRL